MEALQQRLNQAVKEQNARLEELRKETAQANAAPLILVINTVDGRTPTQDEIREEVLQLLDERS
jgi:hypothetical protein